MDFQLLLASNQFWKEIPAYMFDSDLAMLLVAVTLPQQDLNIIKFSTGEK